jgi:hypothetical protein
MITTRTFLIYDSHGEHAIVTLSGASVEDMRDEGKLYVVGKSGQLVGMFEYYEGMLVREIK